MLKRTRPAANRLTMIFGHSLLQQCLGKLVVVIELVSVAAAPELDLLELDRSCAMLLKEPVLFLVSECSLSSCSGYQQHFCRSTASRLCC